MGYFSRWIRKRNTLTSKKLGRPLRPKPIKLLGSTKGSLMIPFASQVYPLHYLVYSYECPDLTLIDLPGITRISVGQQMDIEKVTT